MEQNGQKVIAQGMFPKDRSQEIKIGLDQIERGEVSDGEAFFDELEKEMDN